MWCVVLWRFRALASGAELGTPSTTRISNIAEIPRDAARSRARSVYPLGSRWEHAPRRDIVAHMLLPTIGAR